MHIRAGYTAHTAIDRIRATYGMTAPVTTLINCMVKDKKRRSREFKSLKKISINNIMDKKIIYFNIFYFYF